jgi:tRNA-uridine 2-sulfurtransferase
VEANVLYVDQGDSAWLDSRQLRSGPAHWIAGSPPAGDFRCRAQVRYRQSAQECAVRVADDGTLQVDFDQPQRAVTPGQSVVLYVDDECLGGAVIEATDVPPLPAQGAPR